MRTIIPILLMASLLFSVPVHADEKWLEAQGGTLALPQSSFEHRFLKGDWRLSSQQLTALDEEAFLQLPATNPFTANLYFQSLNPGPSSGAFVLKVESPAEMKLVMSFDGLVSSSQIILFHKGESEVLFQDPSFGGTLDDSIQQITNLQVPLDLPAGSSFLIYNFEQRPFVKAGGNFQNIGFSGAVALGSKAAVEKRFHFSEFFLKVPLGVFLCLSVYSLLIYFSRNREDQESLLLFIINVSTFIKETLTQLGLLNIFPNNLFLISLSTLGFSLPIFSTGIAMIMLQRLHPSRFMKIVTWATMANFAVGAVNGVLIPNASFLPPTGQVALVNFAGNFIGYFFCFMPYTFYHAFKTRRPETMYYALGLTAIAIGQVLDFVNISFTLGWPWMAMWGGMILSILLAKNNAMMFARAFESSKRLNIELGIKNKEVEELNHGLEQKVQERTAEINALLAHIPQGVLSIGALGMVEPNYSAHLPDVLGHDAIRGRSFLDLVLKPSHLSSDERDQCWNSILASVGEAAFNFEVNSDKLPTVIGFQAGNVEKTIRLTWNVEVTPDDRVNRILVTLLDITAEVEARKELEEKNRDFVIIKQLLEIGPKKSVQFFSSAHQLLDENRRLIAHSDLDISTLKILFVNLHTVKGAARTLQLKEMAALLHDAEAHYSDIIKGSASIERQRMLDDIDQTKIMLDRYERVNKEILGRDDDLSRVAIERDFLEEHFKLLNLLDTDFSLSPDIRDVIHKNKDELTVLIFMSLPNVLSEMLNQAEKIARDLQKEQPILKLNIDEILISHRQEVAIKNSFIHLLRNALDHGIEPAAERQAKHKPPAGTIHVVGKEVDGMIRIEVWDDGRGLAIRKLRDNGLAQGLLARNARPEEVAETIFMSGISTAKSVSLVSGRGVGMDAVRRFLRQERGDIQIELGEAVDQAGEYQRFKFIITLPLETQHMDKSQIQSA